MINVAFHGVVLFEADTTSPWPVQSQQLQVDQSRPQDVGTSGCVDARRSQAMEAEGPRPSFDTESYGVCE